MRARASDDTHPDVARQLLDQPQGRLLDGLGLVDGAAHDDRRHVDARALLERHADAERLLDGFDWRRVDVGQRLEDARHRNVEHEHEW